MYIFYNHKTDYLEVFRVKTENYGVLLKRGLTEFRAEKNDKIVGYGVENISKLIQTLDFLSPTERFSILVKIARLKKGLTQTQVAEKLGMKLLPYQRIESGTNNPTLKTIVKIKTLFPDISLSKVA